MEYFINQPADSKFYKMKGLSAEKTLDWSGGIEIIVKHRIIGCGPPSQYLNTFKREIMIVCLTMWSLRLWIATFPVD